MDACGFGGSLDRMPKGPASTDFSSRILQMEFANRRTRNLLWMEELWVSAVSGLCSHAETAEESIVGCV